MPGISKGISKGFTGRIDAVTVHHWVISQHHIIMWIDPFPIFAVHNFHKLDLKCANTFHNVFYCLNMALRYIYTFELLR